MTKMRTLAFEIGTEEIPALPLARATVQLKKLAAEALNEAGLSCGEIDTYSTPRRLVLLVNDLAQATEAQHIRAKGPSASIAYDADGNPTKAAMGFARGKGLDVNALECEKDESGTEYVYAAVDKPAISALELLPNLLAGLITGLEWPKSQRWGSRHETFSRPVRWLLALFGEEVVPVQFAGLQAGRITFGHRLIANKKFEIDSADDLLDSYKKMSVVVSVKDRAQRVREQIAAFEKESGLRVDTPQGIFNEVLNLVEWPTVLIGHFDERFLEIPPEIITDAMLEHQRYFPAYKQDGSLDNAFVVVGNGKPERSAVIVEGNERVVRARLDDAAFFVAEDLRYPLEHYVAGLDDVVFQEKLGSVGSKARRIEKIAAHICDEAELQAADRDDALRAAKLAKADLVTSAVIEFTSLQGVMGGHYARACGETEGVALAITDHYKPRFAGDELPRNVAGKVVALADKIDTICGIFAIGDLPTGSSDPFALRRAAIGIINILLDGMDVSLKTLFDVTFEAYKQEGLDFDREKVHAHVAEFFATRLAVIAKDRNFKADVVQAVMRTGMFEPAETLARIRALTQARQNNPELFENLATAFARANNLRDSHVGTDYDEASLTETQQALSNAITEAEEKLRVAYSEADYEAALAALASLRAPIDLFFDKVLIKDKDEDVRRINMQLLNRFVAVFAGVADMSALAKK